MVELAEFFKTKRRHEMALNDVAWAIVQHQRDGDSQYVFMYQPVVKLGVRAKAPHRMEQRNAAAPRRGDRGQATRGGQRHA